jgi:hypothetical protein
MLDELLKHLPAIAVILSAAALALTGTVFALFLKPKLKVIDDLSRAFDKHKAHFETLQVAHNLSVLQRIQTDVALLQQAESQRNDRLNAAIAAQNKSIEELEKEIEQEMDAGDNRNTGMYLAWRVEQLETAYVLSRIQGGPKEEEARDRWARAKDDLAKFLTSQQEESQR